MVCGFAATCCICQCIHSVFCHVACCLREEHQVKGSRWVLCHLGNNQDLHSVIHSFIQHTPSHVDFMALWLYSLSGAALTETPNGCDYYTLDFLTHAVD